MCQGSVLGPLLVLNGLKSSIHIAKFSKPLVKTLKLKCNYRNSVQQGNRRFLHFRENPLQHPLMDEFEIM